MKVNNFSLWQPQACNRQLSECLQFISALVLSVLRFTFVLYVMVLLTKAERLLKFSQKFLSPLNKLFKHLFILVYTFSSFTQHQRQCGVIFFFIFLCVWQWRQEEVRRRQRIRYVCRAEASSSCCLLCAHLIHFSLNRTINASLRGGGSSQTLWNLHEISRRIMHNIEFGVFAMQICHIAEAKSLFELFIVTVNHSRSTRAHCRCLAVYFYPHYHNIFPSCKAPTRAKWDTDEVILIPGTRGSGCKHLSDVILFGKAMKNLKEHDKREKIVAARRKLNFYFYARNSHFLVHTRADFSAKDAKKVFLILTAALGSLCKLCDISRWIYICVLQIKHANATSANSPHLTLR